MKEREFRFASGQVNCLTIRADLGGHPHEVGERICSHLLHHLSTMGFDGKGSHAVYVSQPALSPLS